jgi:hypothetical protein
MEIGTGFLMRIKQYKLQFSKGLFVRDMTEKEAHNKECTLGQ